MDDIPKEDQPKDDPSHCCLEIYLPDNCQHCGKRINVMKIGDKNNCGGLNSPICEHFVYWSSLWNNRIKDQVIKFNYLDPKDDGCKCNKCGLWSPMAAPNQIDNTFKCYTCRNRGW